MNPVTRYYVFTVEPHNWWRAVKYTTERGKPEIVHIATHPDDRREAEKACEEHESGTIDWDRTDALMSTGKVIR